MIRVLICDDQEVVRRGLQVILAHAAGIEVVGTASNGEQAVAYTAELAPDVVLIDLKMPILTGVEATRQIVRGFPAVRVLVLTTYDADEWVFDALRAGASGYLLKETDSVDLIRAIHETAAGQTRLDPQVAGKVVAGFRQGVRPVSAAALAQFTERERTVLQLMANGKTNQEIAAELFLAVGTVKNNVSNIIGKLHVHDRTQAVIHALRLGIVSLEA